MGACINKHDTSRSLIIKPDGSYTINNQDGDDCTYYTLTDSLTITKTFRTAWETRTINQNFQKHCISLKRETLRHSIKSRASVDPEDISFSQAIRNIQDVEIQRDIEREVSSKKVLVENKYGVYVCSSCQHYYENRDSLIAPYKVHLEEPDVSWNANALKVKALLQKMECSNEWEMVEHIGSTAIPGLVAKPVIDLMIVLEKESDFARLFEQFLKEQAEIPALPVKIAFKCKAPPGDDEWGFFQVPHQAAIENQMCEVNIHLYRDGAQNVLDKLVFRDFLSSEEGSELRNEYGERKRQLMEMLERNELSVGQYAINKTEIVAKILAAAKEWRNKMLQLEDQSPSVSLIFMT